MDFVYRSRRSRADITTPGGRAKALEDALTLIYPLRDSYMIDTYFIQIADLLGLDLETGAREFGRVFRDVAKREDAERRREQNYERQRAQAERAAVRRDEARAAVRLVRAVPVAVPGPRVRRRRCPHRSRRTRTTTFRLMPMGPHRWRSSRTCRQSMCRREWKALRPLPIVQARRQLRRCRLF